MIISNDAIELGDLVVMDAVHVPYGCSVWPAFWTLDPDVADDTKGEIDIFESVNQVTTGQYTLHTEDGCKQTNVSSMPYSDASVLSTNCYYKANGNQGCAFTDSRDNTVGEGFASAGGGVHAMLWDGDGIRVSLLDHHKFWSSLLMLFLQVWFFSRDSIPDDLSSGSPDPSGWDDPQASWPAAGCNPQTYFSNQHLILYVFLFCFLLVNRSVDLQNVVKATLTFVEAGLAILLSLSKLAAALALILLVTQQTTTTPSLSKLDGH